MIKVKLREDYAQEYWDSANGVTIKKGEEKEIDEDNPVVRHAIDNHILEVLMEAKDNITIIDTPTKPTIKEVATPSGMAENKKVVQDLKEKTRSENVTTKSTDKGNSI